MEAAVAVVTKVKAPFREFYECTLSVLRMLNIMGRFPYVPELSLPSLSRQPKTLSAFVFNDFIPYETHNMECN